MNNVVIFPCKTKRSLTRILNEHHQYLGLLTETMDRSLFASLASPAHRSQKISQLERSLDVIGFLIGHLNDSSVETQPQLRIEPVRQMLQLASSKLSRTIEDYAGQRKKCPS